MAKLNHEDFDYDPYYLSDSADDRMSTASTNQVRNDYHTLLTDDEISLRRKTQRSTTRPLIWTRRDIRNGGGSNTDFVQFMTPAHVAIDNKFEKATIDNGGRSSDIACPVGTTDQAMQDQTIFDAHGGIDKVWGDIENGREPQVGEDDGGWFSVLGGFLLIAGFILIFFTPEVGVAMLGIGFLMAMLVQVGKNTKSLKQSNGLSNGGALLRVVGAIFLIGIGPIGWCLAGYWFYRACIKKDVY